MVEIQTFGMEIEFPIIQLNEFKPWHKSLERIEVPAGARFYQDGTPCAEYASAVNNDYEKLVEELRTVFAKVMELIPNSVAFFGYYPHISSTFSGHIHVGQPQGLTLEQARSLLDSLQGSQTLMELLAQNNKTPQASDARGASRDYYRFLHFKEWHDKREYKTYTYNDGHRTIENRTPPSSDFYHLLTCLLVEKAWARRYENVLTLDVDYNFNEAMKKGVAGSYFLTLGDEIVSADYTTYVTVQLMKVQKELSEEMEKLKPDTRKKVAQYLEFLKRTTMAEYTATLKLRQVKEMAKAMVYEGKSFIDGVEITPLRRFIGQVSEEAVKAVLERLGKSAESESQKRMLSFVNAVKQSDAKMCVNEQDKRLVERILAKRSVEMVI